MPNQNPPQPKYSFVKKVWIVGAIFALIAVLLLIFEATFNIIILVLAGVMIACYFRGISRFLQNRFNWGPAVSIAFSVLVSIVVFGGIFYLVGHTVASETAMIKKSFPKMMTKAEQELQKTGLGREVLKEVQEIKSSKEFSNFKKKFVKTSLAGLTNIYIVLLIGIFFTLNPRFYVSGIIALVPPKQKEKADNLISDIGESLIKWLAGKFVAMFCVFVLTAIALKILGIPMWLTLSILAGLLNFIPNFGPLASAVPAIIVGFSVSPQMALIIAGLYLVIQVFESSVITPKAQQRLVKIPPALIILAQVFIGALTGIWGVIFATPLILIIIVAVQDLYTKPMEQKASIKAKSGKKI